MNTLADRLLLDQIRASEAAAWEQFIARYEGRLLAFVKGRIAHQSQAEDIVQDTFVGFLTSLPNYDDATPLESFLFAIAAHKLTDELRRQGRRPTLQLLMLTDSGRGQEPVGPARKASSLCRSREDRSGERRVLQDCLRDLITGWLRAGEFERMKCAELLLVLGWPNKRVAEQLGLSEQAVANHKFFILSKLKAAADRAQQTSPTLTPFES